MVTPQVTRAGWKLVPLTWTNWKRLVKNKLIQLKTRQSMFKAQSLYNRILCKILSNALQIFKKMQSTKNERSIDVWRLCVSFKSWVSHQNSFLKPCWAGGKNVGILRKLTRWEEVKCSRISQGTLVREIWAKIICAGFLPAFMDRNNLPHVPVLWKDTECEWLKE